MIDTNIFEKKFPDAFRDFSDASLSSFAFAHQRAWTGWCTAYIKTINAPLRLGDTPSNDALILKLGEDIKAYKRDLSATVKKMEHPSFVNILEDTSKSHIQWLDHLHAQFKNQAHSDERSLVLAVKVGQAYIQYSALAMEALAALHPILRHSTQTSEIDRRIVAAKVMTSTSLNILNTASVWAMGDQPVPEEECLVQTLEALDTAFYNAPAPIKSLANTAQQKEKTVFDEHAIAHKCNWAGLYDLYLKILNDGLAPDLKGNKDLAITFTRQELEKHYEYVAADLTRFQTEIEQESRPEHQALLHKFYDLIKGRAQEDLDGFIQAADTFKDDTGDKEKAEHVFNVKAGYAMCSMLSYHVARSLKSISVVTHEDLVRSVQAAEEILISYKQAVDTAQDQALSEGRVDRASLSDDFKPHVLAIFAQESHASEAISHHLERLPHVTFEK